MGALIDGFATALTLANLGWCVLGVTLGTAIGILPGIGPALTIALLLPVTAHLDPTGAFIMFAGLYYGAMYGSSTTSILLNTPGETGSIITAIEGNLMARQGRGAAALATAAIGSFVAGTIGTVLLTFLAPLVVKVALSFGPAEYFALMVLAFTTVSGAARHLAAARHDQPVPGAGHRPGRHRQPDRARRASRSASRSCSTASTSSWWRSACSRSARRSMSRRGADLRTAQIIPIKGSLWMTREEWAPLVEAVAARLRSSASRSARCRPAAPRSRPSSPTSSRRSCRSSRRSSARARSKASPGRRPPTIPRSPACWCRC